VIGFFFDEPLRHIQDHSARVARGCPGWAARAAVLSGPPHGLCRV